MGEQEKNQQSAMLLTQKTTRPNRSPARACQNLGMDAPARDDDGKREHCGKVE